MDGEGLKPPNSRTLRTPRSSRAARSVEPAEIVGVVLALEERAALSEVDRRRGDRELRVRLGECTDLELIRRWLESASSESLSARVARLAASLRTLHGLLWLIGIFFGWGAAAALLSIEGDEGRINVVLCVVLLVLLPTALLVASLLVVPMERLVRGRRRDRVGAHGGFGLGSLVLRLLPGSIRNDLDIVLGRVTAQGRLYGGVYRRQLGVWSQTLGLGFGLGALAAIGAFVVFTDLAFGWSTTLDVSPSQLHRLTGILSLPWAGFWPEASPSLELVESTRFFRVAHEEHLHWIDPIVYGGWWPFLTMTVLCYSVLPRCVVRIGMGIGLTRATRRALRSTPGVAALLEELTTPEVETRSDTPETRSDSSADSRSGIAAVDLDEWLREGTDASGKASAGEVFLLRWAEAADDDGLRALLAPIEVRIRDVGGRRNLEEDAERVRECGRDADAVVLCVRAFEPPLLEVHDFLADLRAAVGPGQWISVLLLEGNSEDERTWRRGLARLGDPWLRVVRSPVRGDEAGVTGE